MGGWEGGREGEGRREGEGEEGRGGERDARTVHGAQPPVAIDHLYSNTPPYRGTSLIKNRHPPRTTLGP